MNARTVHIVGFAVAVMACRGAILAQPAPVDDVMVPTRHVVRSTPATHEAFAQYLVEHEISRTVLLRPDQKRKMTQLLSRRMRAISEEWRDKGDPLAEGLVAAFARNSLIDMPLDPESARQTSERVRPALDIAADFWRHLPEDVGPILDPEQQREVIELSDSVQEFFQHIFDRLDRWGRGEVAPNEKLFTDIQAESAPARDGEGPDLAQAKRSAAWMLRWTGPNEWRALLNSCIRAFHFDAAQQAAGEKLVREYSEKARPIMTDQWRSAVVANRIESHILWTIGGDLEPWAFRVDEEYRQMTAPISTLGRSFRREIARLINRGQRDRLLADLRRVGDEHGMSAEEIRAVMSLFPETQPEGR